MFRALVTRIPELGKYKGKVNWHIKHPMSDVMANMSVIVTLGVVNESEQEDEGHACHFPGSLCKVHTRQL